MFLARVASSSFPRLVVASLFLLLPLRAALDDARGHSPAAASSLFPSLFAASLLFLPWLHRLCLRLQEGKEFALLFYNHRKVKY